MSALATAASWVSAPPALAGTADPAVITFDLPADHGLHAHLETFNGEVTLDIERKHRAVVYETKGESTAVGLKVRFGKLGRIDVAFEPTETRKEAPPKGCTGPPSVLSQGEFVGTIEFTGEREYVHIDAGRASGVLEVSREADWHCPRQNPSKPIRIPARRPSLDLLKRAEAEREPATLVARDPDCRCFFAAYALRDRQGRGPTFFVGSETEQREAMKISRATYTRAGAAAFVFDHAAGTATVRPPSPFIGHAVFQRRPNARALWRSTLRVPLLGAETLSFRGPHVPAALRRSFPEDD